MSDVEDDAVIRKAKDQFSKIEDWERYWRPLYDYDYKFANADAHNRYQWESTLFVDRLASNRPCLTINKTFQHNLLIINDSKQNKPGVNIRPVGDSASFEAAQIYQEIVRHIEYNSNAESAYDNATEFQVHGGIGYWRGNTDYVSDKSFDQEIYIRPIKDPRCVYLDPNINEADGSDATHGFIIDEIDRDLFNEKYPDFKNEVGWKTPFDTAVGDTWISRNNIRVAEYYTKTQKRKKLVTFIDPVSQQQVLKFYDELTEEGKILYKALRGQPMTNEREVITDDIQWYKIAGDIIIERGPWLGKYIPIIRCVGIETVIDGILDRKGHTRALINAQQMYNVNTSANTEFGALQTKAPWLAPAAAIEGYEEYYRTANINNHSFLPYNHIDDDGNQIPPPSRPQPPQASPAYVEGLKIANEEMMMASGQYQAQFGENENAKSGVAINARQRQGDRSTYHFIDNQAKAIRYTGKILIDLIPKIYDTERVIRIQAKDNSILNININPQAEQAYQKVPYDPEIGPEMDGDQEIVNIIFNPLVGQYDVQSEVGPSFATKRQEAFNALTQIAAQNQEFMGIAGDVLWRVADFPEAQVLAERWRKVIPKNITGDAPDPQLQAQLKQAADQIEKQLSVIAKQAQELADKQEKFDLEKAEFKLRAKVEASEQRRLDYDAVTKRITALGNSGPGITPDEAKPAINQVLDNVQHSGELPPVEGARKAPDGEWYLNDPDRPGKYLKIQQDELNDFHPSLIGAKQAPDGNFYIKRKHSKGDYIKVNYNGKQS